MQITAVGETINLIHFITEVNIPPLNEGSSPTPQYRIVCMPNMTEFHKTKYHRHYQRTDDPRAATCPSCKKSPLYVKAMEALKRG